MKDYALKMLRVLPLVITLIVTTTVTDAQNDLVTRARALHKQVPLIDGHNDYPWALREHNAERDINRLDIRAPQPNIHTDIRACAPAAWAASSGRSTCRRRCRARPGCARRSSRWTSSTA